MRPKPDVDPELLSRPKPWPRPWYQSIRSLGRLMTLVALSGLAVAAYSERPRPNPSRLGMRNLMLRQRIPGSLQQLPLPSSVDSSIIVAPPGIDEAMIVTARAGIDEAMIVSPRQLRTGPMAATPILPPAATRRAPLSPWPMAPQAPPPR